MLPSRQQPVCQATLAGVEVEKIDYDIRNGTSYPKFPEGLIPTAADKKSNTSKCAHAKRFWLVSHRFLDGTTPPLPEDTDTQAFLKQYAKVHQVFYTHVKKKLQTAGETLVVKHAAGKYDIKEIDTNERTGVDRCTVIATFHGLQKALQSRYLKGAWVKYEPCRVFIARLLEDLLSLLSNDTSWELQGFQEYLINRALGHNEPSVPFVLPQEYIDDITRHSLHTNIASKARDAVRLRVLTGAKDLCGGEVKVRPTKKRNSAEPNPELISSYEFQDTGSTSTTVVQVHHSSTKDMPLALDGLREKIIELTSELAKLSAQYGRQAELEQDFKNILRCECYFMFYLWSCAMMYV